MPDSPNTRRFDHGVTEVLTRHATAPAVPDRPSDPATRYVAGAEIARGGMGRVVVGTDTRLGREVAIKEALPHGGDLDRFEREVRITARLEHPSIVPLYDAGVTASGRPFYVMRKVSGQPLERLVAERTAPPTRQAIDRAMVDQRLALVPHVLAAAHAVGHAHRRGVIHRDVKPANILVGDLGETVVIDWGLAKVLGEDDRDADPARAGADAHAADPLAPPTGVATQTGAVFGTPAFMAPEQARGEPLDPRSDVYALGATLYHVLTGAPPVTGALTEIIAGAHDPKRIEPALLALAALPVPPELAAIADKAMQFDPANRYPDAAELADDLVRFLAGRLVAAHNYTLAERMVRFIRRHRALVSVTVASAIVVTIGSAIAFRGIVAERERAQRAEQAAIAGQRAAELAREREADRADDAVILKARADVERDPTSAIAALAGLAPQSRRWPLARPIAIEARVRGIAQVYPAEFPPRTMELAPDPRALLVAGSSPGQVSIIDLVHNRSRELPCRGRCAAAWGDRGAAVWIAPAAGGLYAIDLATGAQRPPVVDGAVTQLRADTAATYLGFALDDGSAGWIDAGEVHRLTGLADKISEVRVAPDGAWAAFASSRELIVVDRTGRELLRERGAIESAALVQAASGRQIAVLVDKTTILEIDLVPGDPGGGPGAAVSATVHRSAAPWKMFWLTYVDDTLYVNQHNAVQMRPLHELDSRGAELPHLWSSRPTWQGYTALASTELLQLDGPTPRVLTPPIRDQIIALAGRRDSRYLAAHMRSAVVTWDLDDVVPRQVASDVIRSWIFDDRLAIISDIQTCEWVDLATGERTPIATPHGLVTWERADAASGRQLLYLERTGEPPTAVIVRRARSAVEPVRVPGLRRVDLVGPDTIVGTVAGDVVVAPGSGGAPRVLHHFDSEVDTVVGNGHWIAALARSGALIRADLATGTVDAAQPPFPIRYTLVEPSGDIYLATGPDLHRWRGRGFERIATLPGPIATIDSIRDRETVVAATDARAIYAVEPGAPERDRLTRLFFRTAAVPPIDAIGRYMAVDTLNGDTTVLDLLRGTRWRLPWPDPVNSISPTGRTALLFRGGRVSVVQLDAPDDPVQLRDWVVHATNYTLDATAGP